MLQRCTTGTEQEHGSHQSHTGLTPLRVLNGNVKLQMAT